MLTVVMLAAAACSSSGSDRGQAPDPSTSSTSSTSFDLEAPGAFEDELTPLVVSVISADPIPVKGSDGRFHVAYELSVLNDAPYPALITSLDTIAVNGDVVTSLDQAQVRALTMVVPEISIEGAPATGIPAGATGLLVLEDVYADRESVPESVTHRIAASFNPGEGGAAPSAALWPSTVTQTTASMAISGAEAIVLGAPLAGRGWVTGNGCCDALNLHRNVLFPVAGTINAGERFGIDFTAVTPDLSVGTPLAVETELEPGTTGARSEDYLAYGAPVLAVADATVVKVTLGAPDRNPGVVPTGEGLTINDLGGNTVVLELAPDLFAFYFHLAPDATTVAVGDRVTKGQAIAQLGNSGNSSAPHLHFQIGRSPRFFSGENVPYVFEDFELKGTLTEAGLVAEPAPGSRREELPLHESVVDFPAEPS